MLNHRKTAAQFVKYTACGLVNCSISYSVFLALYWGVGLHYVPASGLGYCAGMVNSFLLNRAFTFNATGAVPPMIARFAVVTGVGISLNLLSLQWIVTFFRLAPEVAQVFALVCSGCLNFAGNKAWTFRPVPVKAEA